MTSLAWLIPAALFLGLIGLAAFLWALRDGQFDDLEGASWRILDDREPADIENEKRARRKAGGKDGHGSA